MRAALVGVLIGVTGTYPCSMQAVCGAPFGVLTDLATMSVWSHRASSDSTRIATFNAEGMECQPFMHFIEVGVGDTLWTTTEDHNGNVSCAGNRIVVPVQPPPVTGDVPDVPSWGGAARTRWYDITGRRLDGAPRTPGLYWKQEGLMRPRRIVIVR